MSKPYKVIGREEGCEEKKFETEFDTLSEAAHYIKERWQGPEYMDGVDGFHTDYSTYDLVGFDLNDIGKRFWSTEWKCWEFEFKPINEQS